MIAAKLKFDGVTVEDCIVVDAVPEGFVECPEWVGIGMRIDAPEPAGFTSEALPRQAIPVDQFRDRFTPEEMDAVLALAYDGDAMARRLLLKVQTSREIDLDSPETIGGLDYLIAKGVLADARKEEILDGTMKED